MSAISRRMLLLSAATISMIGLMPAMAQDQVTLRMVWWGSDTRTQATLAAIKLFEEAHPNIKVQAEALPFDGYSDKLATQFAANDAPDLIQLLVEAVPQYAEAGALLNIDKVDLTNLEKTTTEAAFINGQQAGIGTGLASGMIVANKTLFDAAGVKLPDDRTWTWDDYSTIAKAISDKSAEGVYGSQPFGMDGGSFGTYLTQLGTPPYDAEGKITMDPASVVSYLELAKKLWDEGASAGPETASEFVSLPLEQSGSATNVAAMGFWASSQYTAVATASGDEMVPLRFPSQPGQTNKAMMSVGTPQYWGISSRTAHPAEAQELLNFLVNDIGAGKALMLARGTPPNALVRDAIIPELSPVDATAVQYISDLQPDAIPTVAPPSGYGVFQDTFRRYTAEYLFGRMSAEDAANQMIGEIKAAVGQ